MVPEPEMSGRPTAAARAYCPHCFLLMEERVHEPWPVHATRCRHCRLMVGPGRGRSTSAARPGARGTAAGVFAHQARRYEEARGVSPEAICAAIRSVAVRLDLGPERLLMVDYQQCALADASLPALSDVFTVFGSWKRARREAALH